MVRWYDGLYGGLIAGGVVAVFYWIVTVTLLRDTTLAGFFAQIASGILKDKATPDNGWAVAFGVGLHFLLAAAFGIIYAWVARRVPAMWHAPTSVLFGLVYGLLVWFCIANLIVPLAGIASTQPLWVGLIGNTIFYGFVISEFMTIAQSAKSAAAA